jgi:hypothetical protein
MPDDSQAQVRFRQLSWEEICRKAWGKDWTKPDPAYEFSSGRNYEDPKVGGPYNPADFDL